jgi:hypothetical protein
MRGRRGADTRSVSTFGFVTVIGIGICFSTSLRGFISWGDDPKRPTWSDPMNMGGYWRGWLQLGAATTAVGLVGLLVVAATG